MASHDTIEIYQGEDVVLPFTMNPNPVADGGIDGWTIQLTIRGAGVAYALSGTVDDGTAGTFHFILPAEVSALLRPGSLSYDVWRIDDGSERALAAGIVTVLESVRLYE